MSLLRGVTRIFSKQFNLLFQVTFTAKSGMTLHATVPAEHHDLVRAVVANNYVAMADCGWKNKQLRERLEDRVCKEISSECTTLNSSQSSPFKLDNNESLKHVTPGEQEAELNQKAQLLLKCLKYVVEEQIK